MTSSSMSSVVRGLRIGAFEGGLNNPLKTDGFDTNVYEVFYSDANSGTYFNTNILNTFDFLEAMRKIALENSFVFSSDIYGEPETISTDEEASL